MTDNDRRSAAQQPEGSHKVPVHKRMETGRSAVHTWTDCRLGKQKY